MCKKHLAKEVVFIYSGIMHGREYRCTARSDIIKQLVLNF